MPMALPSVFGNDFAISSAFRPMRSDAGGDRPAYEAMCARKRGEAQVSGTVAVAETAAAGRRKVAISHDDDRAKPLPDDQLSATAPDSSGAVPSKVDGRSPESRKRTIMARYVFGDGLKPGERWKRRLLTPR